MRLYYMTDVAELILLGGFGDGSHYGFATLTHSGGIVSDRPVGITEGAVGEQIIELTFPDNFDLTPYELPYAPDWREWCIPAPVLNKHARIGLLNDDDTVDAWIHSWRPTVQNSTL